jgi:hypothetical protein
MWLTATKLGVAVHPMSFLPYAFARVFRGSGKGLAPATVRGLASLRPDYVRLWGLDGSEGEVLLFRLFPAGTPLPTAVRRPVEAVLRFERSDLS